MNRRNGCSGWHWPVLLLLVILLASAHAHAAADPKPTPYKPKLKWCQPSPSCKTRSCVDRTGDSCERSTREGGLVCWDPTAKSETAGTNTRVCFEKTKCYSYPRTNLRCTTK
jgi:hypothetical protein